MGYLLNYSNWKNLSEGRVSAITEVEIIDISDESTYPTNKKFKNKDYFMIHHTAGHGTARGVVTTLNTPTPDRNYPLGIQWVVDLDGKIYRSLPANTVGAHVGNHQKNPKVSNYNTEGVEVVGDDDAYIKSRHEADIAKGILPRQAEAVRQLVKYLGYSPDQIVGHGEVSTKKAPDEGKTIKEYVIQNWDKPVDSNFTVSDIEQEADDLPELPNSQSKPEVSGALVKRGSTGAMVKAIQLRLGLSPSGTYDTETYNSVREFQSKNKDASGRALRVDGIVGPKTREALFGKQEVTPENNQITPSGESADVILMGGLDYRAGDYKIDEQVRLLSSGFSTAMKVVGHRYTEITAVLASISKNPKAKVVLFSAGCAYASQVANAMSTKNNLYIVEPYAASQSTKTSVQSAVSLGVPSKNVIVGPSQSRGSGVVDGATPTPSGKSHWDALPYVGNLISSGKTQMNNLPNTEKNVNYVIGDSQTPFIDKNSSKVSKISDNQGKESLWKGGVGLNWLKDAVSAYPVSPNVNSIFINIGTNGGFNKGEDVKGLVDQVRSKFPNAKLYAIQGSWGWGGNKNVTLSKVNDYYKKFSDAGVTVLTNAIGSVNDPHGNLPIYATIGKEIDSLV